MINAKLMQSLRWADTMFSPLEVAIPPLPDSVRLRNTLLDKDFIQNSNSHEPPVAAAGTHYPNKCYLQRMNENLSARYRRGQSAGYLPHRRHRCRRLVSESPILAAAGDDDGLSMSRPDYVFRHGPGFPTADGEAASRRR